MISRSRGRERTPPALASNSRTDVTPMPRDLATAGQSRPAPSNSHTRFFVGSSKAPPSSGESRCDHPLNPPSFSHRRLSAYQPRRLSPPSRPLAGWLPLSPVPALSPAVLPLSAQHLRDAKEAERGRDGRKADKRTRERTAARGAGRRSETTTATPRRATGGERAGSRRDKACW